MGEPTMRWRLLVTEPADGATNMALDEALWRSRLSGEGPPTLRLFGWTPPTVSVGYGQRLDRHLSPTVLAGLGVGLVRRPTGGSAIYHDGPDCELTYSVVAGVGDFPDAGELLGAYRWIARALVCGLRSLGVPAEMAPAEPSAAPPTFCFARTGSYEIEVAGRKLVGSAQRRRARGFLQHGAVLLRADAARLRALFPGEADPSGVMTTIDEATGRAPGFAAVAQAIAEAFVTVHGIDLVPGVPDERERALAADLAREKYSTSEWNEHGRYAWDLSRVS